MPEIARARKTEAAGTLTGPGLARDPWTRRKSETPGGQPRRPRMSSGRRRENVPGLTLHLCGRLESVALSYQG